MNPVFNVLSAGARVLMTGPPPPGIARGVSGTESAAWPDAVGPRGGAGGRETPRAAGTGGAPAGAAFVVGGRGVGHPRRGGEGEAGHANRGWPGERGG